MKRFYLVLAFLFAVVASLFVAPVSMAAVHHSNVQQQSRHQRYSVGTFYYSFSSLTTAGGYTFQGGPSGVLTLHIAADGTVTGVFSGSSRTAAADRIVGSFQSDGSLRLSVVFSSVTTNLIATVYPQKDGKYTGTFIFSISLYVRSGIVALVPVNNPQNVVAIYIGALTASGPDQTRAYSGVAILDRSGTFGTFRLQDGRVLPIVAHITQEKMTFTFSPDIFEFVYGTGTSSTIGVVTEYTGTFVGPQQSDNGNWFGSPPLAFVL